MDRPSLRECLLILTGMAMAALSACRGQKTICPPSTEPGRYLSVPPVSLASPTPALSVLPLSVKIGGRLVPVDRVVSGALCNDSWSGTVYVTCDVQVYPWDEKGDPTFLKDCDLQIAPDTVVYVAHHNDAAYYKGCSCHTGELSNP